jgi:hypothetical protein
MAKKYDFDVNSSEYDAKSHELEIIELWDSLPDYCKTPQILEKVKTMASPILLDKLKMTQSLSNLS